MKFKLKQEKMRDLFEKMIVQNLFPMSIIKATETEVISLQKEANATAIRFARFKKEYFDELKVEESEVIELDIQRALAITKKVLPGTILTFETKGDKVIISGERVNINLSYKKPKEDEILETMPFDSVKEGIPVIKGVALDTEIKIKLADLKDAVDYGASLSTEYYTFKTKKGKLEIRVGDLHKYSDFVIFKPKIEVDEDKETETIYTTGLTQISNTFIEDELTIKYASDAPALIYEKNNECMLSILLPPQPKSKED